MGTKTVEEGSRKILEALESTRLLDAIKAILKYKEFHGSAKANFEICKSLIGATAGYVALLSEDGSENDVLFLDTGGNNCTIDPNLPMPIRGLRAEVFKTGKVLYDNNFIKSQWVKFIPTGHAEFKNVMFAPLKIENKAVGLIGLANKEGGFNHNDIKIVSAFSELTAIALNNSMMIENL
ncbi:hypothetical protein LCGC14_1720050 [marine sediment metagenome]|uniref:GAF domain-containing protein n=1 Tax=marine sediment metagenome TaxID=412755 RepID=A0A0F9KCK0_9ZZZZ